MINIRDIFKIEERGHTRDAGISMAISISMVVFGSFFMWLGTSSALAKQFLSFLF